IPSERTHDRPPLADSANERRSVPMFKRMSWHQSRSGMGGEGDGGHEYAGASERASSMRGGGMVSEMSETRNAAFSRRQLLEAAGTAAALAAAASLAGTGEAQQKTGDFVPFKA